MLIDRYQGNAGRTCPFCFILRKFSIIDHRMCIIDFVNRITYHTGIIYLAFDVKPFNIKDIIPQTMLYKCMLLKVLKPKTGPSEVNVYRGEYRNGESNLLHHHQPASSYL